MSAAGVGSRQVDDQRTILHVDMDAFYVSVEMRRHPELRGQPVVVGGSGSRGVIAAANYEARRFGVFSAMSSSRARRLCPQAVFLPGDHSHYNEVSRQVMAIFGDFTPLVEPIALDEAFLDVTGALHLFGDGPAIGRRIRERVDRELELPCSVGVASTKFVAKLASKKAKPRIGQHGIQPGVGVFQVMPGREVEFLWPLPVSELWGVGPATLAKLSRVGVRTVAELAAFDLSALETIVGQSNGRHLHDLSWGRDQRAVIPERDAKSIGREETYLHDLHDVDEIRTELVRLCDDVAARVRAGDGAARTVTLKVRWSTFETVTRSVTPGSTLSTGASMVHVLDPILAGLVRRGGIRLLGVSASGLCEPVEQLSLLDGVGTIGSTTASDHDRAWGPASRAVDEIRQRFGRSAIAPGSIIGRRSRSSPWGPRVETSASEEEGTQA